MDSLTHIALGACMGEAFAGKTLGKKSMLWGALAQSIPDIDFLSSFWMNTPDSLLAHRGFTHSLLFCVVLTPLMALIAERLHRAHDIRRSRWMFFFGGVILIHIFIDAFNNYGVGWFEPFSHQRVSFNVVYVADPFFSIWPGIAFIALLISGPRSPKRRRWWRTGLGLAALYLSYCLVNKINVDAEIKDILRNQQITCTRYLSTPAPFQNWLWYTVAGNDSGYYVGYRSVLDTKKEIAFQYFPRNDSLLGQFANQEDLKKLIRFSQEFYTVEKWGDTLVFNDLRFGQIIGWQEPRGKFAFHYFLNRPGANKLVVQRGRFAKWDRQSFFTFLRRMKGQ